MLVRSMPFVFVVIWATGFVVARYGMPHAPPMKFLAARYALSVGCFGVWALAARATWPQGARGWLHLSVTGMLMHAIYLGGVWSAVKLGMGAGLTALLVGLQPVLTAIWLSRRGGRVTGAQWVGLFLGLLGLLLVVWAKLGFGEVGPASLGGALLALLGITAGTLYQKRFVTPCDVRTASFIQLLAAFAVTTPLALLETEPMQWVDAAGGLNSELAGAMAWSVLGLTLGGSSLLYLLIQRGAATSVTSLFYLVPPTTAVMAWMLFGEPITGLTVAGTVATAIGVGIVVRKQN
ncbi:MULTISPECIES: DMT family transporter [Cupriavidus]|uniref:DMT family transporter n=1 Tax=Cupriavidus basilensis TaxID=68895 RepID=A0A643G1W7_9BURK|nr:MULTISPECIES: DMT family transporter [Cupriavidus]KUE87969.1 peptide ABC transporter ATP-binding protein [Cupriavidus necator]NOV23737.1 DMT family transporter [Cupriavidus necator]QOT81791.1 DMT family transporter [Cupriavidus basilensis]BDB30356.1 DMT family transporter [Cupriavidus sp. P-10]